jgi:hypothetical protein
MSTEIEITEALQYAADLRPDCWSDGCIVTLAAEVVALRERVNNLSAILLREQYAHRELAEAHQSGGETMSEHEAEIRECLERGLFIDPFAVRGFLRQLERENAELRADKARLDWLLTDEGSSFAFNYLNKNQNLQVAAIDAAMEP